MALRRLSTSSIQTNGKSSKLWDQTTFQSGMFALATVKITSNQTNITFTDIPQNYTHLQVRIHARGTFAASGLSILLGLNGGSELSGFRHHLYGGGSSASGYAVTGAYGIIGGTPGSTVTSNIWGATIIDLLDYTNTNKTKTLRALSGFDANGSGEIVLASSYTSVTAAISSIKFVTDGNWVSGSQISLYGIKVA